jgi:hypothetical protein
MEMKKEIKLLKALSKIFKEPKNKNEELVFGTVLNSYMDASNILMIELKTEEMFNIFKRFVEEDSKLIKCVTLDFKEECKPKSKYHAGYLKYILECFVAIDENPVIEFNTDFPITLECQHFKFILAPRIDNY